VRRPITARVFASIDELAAGVGTHLGSSDWHIVDQAMIDGFAAATGDHQWIHVDVTRAATGPFGTTIAHGFLTLALIPALFWGCR
jgi:acyl dehydratase